MVGSCIYDVAHHGVSTCIYYMIGILHRMWLSLRGSYNHIGTEYIDYDYDIIAV